MRKRSRFRRVAKWVGVGLHKAPAIPFRQDHFELRLRLRAFSRTRGFSEWSVAHLSPVPRPSTSSSTVRSNRSNCLAEVTNLREA